MKLTFLGTGTSHGVPVIACDCKVCKSTDPHNRRYRSSALLTFTDSTDNKTKNLLIDIGPEFRLQALENNIKQIDGVLLTHSHADHLHGIDDLRIFSCVMSKKPENPNHEKYNAPPIKIYTNLNTKEDISFRFSYLFNEVTEGGGHAKIEPIAVNKTFTIGSLKITPIPMMHGHLPTVGWVFTEGSHSIAYLTDCNYISDDSIALIKNAAGILDKQNQKGTLDHLIIDGLRQKPHSTHFNFDEALQTAEKIGGKQVWLTHLTHSHSHAETDEYIQSHTKMNAHPAYDKLVLEVN